MNIEYRATTRHKLNLLLHEEKSVVNNLLSKLRKTEEENFIKLHREHNISPADMKMLSIKIDQKEEIIKSLLFLPVDHNFDEELSEIIEIAQEETERRNDNCHTFHQDNFNFLSTRRACQSNERK